MPMNPAIKVMIVDDSAVVRQVMTEILARDPGIRILGQAMDPLFALEKMQKEWPDVILLDVEMPRMDGITFLRKIMAERPTPVIICSSLTREGAETTMQALAAGAFTIFAKPDLGVKDFLKDSAMDLVSAVRAGTTKPPSKPVQPCRSRTCAAPSHQRMGSRTSWWWRSHPAYGAPST
jgi:two-component system chemotaxis response regulator CheB